MSVHAPAGTGAATRGAHAAPRPVPAPGAAPVPAPRTARTLPILALALAALAAVYLSPLHELLLPSGLEPLRQRFEHLGALAAPAFVLGCALLVGVGAPRLWFAVAGGLLFGWLEGFLLAQVGTLLGCLANFAWGRLLARDLLARRHAPRLQRLLDSLARAPVATNVAVRLCPVGNCLAFNLLLAASPVGTRDFLVGTFLGTLPETLACALFGGSAENGSVRLLLAGAALMAALSAASLRFARAGRTG